MPYGWNGLEYDEKADDKHAVATWCYYCEHCGYIWLPKDFDIGSIDTLDREPPKSCTRCKSKCWSSPHMDYTKNGLRSIARYNASIRQKRYKHAMMAKPEYIGDIIRYFIKNAKHSQYDNGLLSKYHLDLMQENLKLNLN